MIVLAGTGMYLRRAEAGSDDTRPAAATAIVQPAASAVPPPPTPTVAVPPSDTAGGPPAASMPSVSAPAAGGGAGVRAEQASPPRPAAVPPPAVQPNTGLAAPRAATRAPLPQAVPAPAQGVPPAAAPAPAAGEAERLAVTDAIDRIAIRAAAVTDSLETLRAQQARQGLGLRGDIVARQQSLAVNAARADEALARGDLALAARYAAQAERDLDALDRFLGR